MSTRLDFAQKVKAAGGGAEQIQKAMDLYRQKNGAFDDEKTAEPDFTPAPTGVAAVPKETTLKDALNVNAYQYYKDHPEESETGPNLAKFKASAMDLGKDIGSVPKGLSDYAVGKVGQLFGGEDPGTLAQNIASRGHSFIDRTIRDPGTGLTLPFGGELGAVVAKGIPALGGGIIGKLATGAARMGTEGAIQGGTAAEIDGQNPIKGAVTGALAAPVLGGLLKAPGVIGSGIRGIGNAAETMVPGASGEFADIVRGPKTPIGQNRFGIALSPSQAAGVTEGVKPGLELMAQTNPYLQDIPGALAKTNQEAIPAAVLGRRNQLANPVGDLSSISPAEVGGRIEDAARQAKSQIGSKFGAAQDQALNQSGVGKLPLPDRVAAEKGRQGFFKKQEVLDDADNVLRDIGYNPDNATQAASHDMHNPYPPGYTGNETASPNAIKYILAQKELLSNAKTTSDLLAQKRRIGMDVYAGGKGDQPLFNNRDQAILTGFERKLDERIEGQFDQAVGDGPGQISFDAARAAKNLWNAQNMEYSNNRGLLESVDNGLGISSRKVNPESYFSKIKSIGADNLNEIKTAAEHSPAIAPLYKELQSGFFDNYLKASLNPKTMELSPDKLISNWNTMDPALKSAMVPERVSSEMDEIVDLVGKSRLNNAYTVNPSGTAKLNAVIGAIKDPRQAMTAMLFRGPIKEYYATGSAPSLSSVLNVIEKVKSGTSRTAGIAEGVNNGLSLPGMRQFGTRLIGAGSQDQ